MNAPVRLITVWANAMTANGPSRDVSSSEEALAVVAEWIDKYPQISIAPNWKALEDEAVRRRSRDEGEKA